MFNEMVFDKKIDLAATVLESAITNAENMDNIIFMESVDDFYMESEKLDKIKEGTKKFFDTIITAIKEFFEKIQNAIKEKINKRYGIKKYSVSKSCGIPIELAYSQSNHTAKFIYVVTDRTGMKVEYACMFANCMPKG